MDKLYKFRLEIPRTACSSKQQTLRLATSTGEWIGVKTRNSHLSLWRPPKILKIFNIKKRAPKLRRPYPEGSLRKRIIDHTGKVSREIRPLIQSPRLRKRPGPQRLAGVQLFLEVSKKRQYWATPMMISHHRVGIMRVRRWCLSTLGVNPCTRAIFHRWAPSRLRIYFPRRNNQKSSLPRAMLRLPMYRIP